MTGILTEIRLTYKGHSCQTQAHAVWSTDYYNKKQCIIPEIIKNNVLFCMCTTHQHLNVSFESGHPILHLNSLTSRCSVLRNMDYGCLFHWIMGSAQIRDNLKMCGGRLFRVVLPHRGELHLCCSFESHKHQ